MTNKVGRVAGGKKGELASENMQIAYTAQSLLPVVIHNIACIVLHIAENQCVFMPKQLIEVTRRNFVLDKLHLDGVSRANYQQIGALYITVAVKINSHLGYLHSYLGSANLKVSSKERH